MQDEIYQYNNNIITRVKTGINGLDELIEGGFPEKSITLVSGSPGAGKSIMCFQFIYQGIQSFFSIIVLYIYYIYYFWS